MDEICRQCGAVLPRGASGLCPTCGTSPAAPPPEEGPPENRLVEFQHTLLQLTPRVYVTPVLIGLNVLVFIAMVATGVSPFSPTVADLLRWGADFGPLTTQGEWWRLLTGTFVHVGLLHILLNMWVLATAGPLVERMLGNVGFLVMYLVAGLVGSVASLFWNPLLVSAGASGAIFGVYGALLGLLLRSHGSIPTQALAQLRNSGLGFLGFNLIFGIMQPNIDSAAHVGGLVGGFLCGVVLRQPFTLAARAGRPWRNVAAAALGVCLVVAGVFTVMARHKDLAGAAGLTGEMVQRGNLEVYYTNGATKEEAERLCNYLLRSWGPSPNRRSVQVAKTPAGYQFRMVIKKELQQDAKVLKELEFVGARIARDVFDGAPVEIHACDDHMRTLQAFPPRPDLRYGLVEGKVEVFFAADVKREDAQRLAKYLTRALKDAPTQLTVKLAQRGRTLEVHMIVRPEALNDPAVITGLRQDMRDMSVNAFQGTPVALHLCDELMNVVRVLEP